MIIVSKLPFSQSINKLSMDISSQAAKAKSQVRVSSAFGVSVSARARGECNFFVTSCQNKEIVSAYNTFESIGGS